MDLFSFPNKCTVLRFVLTIHRNCNSLIARNEMADFDGGPREGSSSSPILLGDMNKTALTLVGPQPVEGALAHLPSQV